MTTKVTINHKVFQQVYAWNLARMIRLHGEKEGKRLFANLPVVEAVRLYQTEGPGHQTLNN